MYKFKDRINFEAVSGTLYPDIKKTFHFIKPRGLAFVNIKLMFEQLHFVFKPLVHESDSYFKS